MPTRLSVPLSEPQEESRQIAESIADLHYVLSVIIEESKELIPGESQYELTTAWNASNDSNQLFSLPKLITNLTSTPAAPQISYQSLSKSELINEIGKIKRSTLGRLKDSFLMFWNSEPRTDEKRTKASKAASDYLEFAATFVGSIPGYENIVEFISLVKQLISLRTKRGH